jgi:hypothetical protein
MKTLLVAAASSALLFLTACNPAGEIVNKASDTTDSFEETGLKLADVGKDSTSTIEILLKKGCFFVETGHGVPVADCFSKQAASTSYAAAFGITRTPAPSVTEIQKLEADGTLKVNESARTGCITGLSMWECKGRDCGSHLATFAYDKTKGDKAYDEMPKLYTAGVCKQIYSE